MSQTLTLSEIWPFLACYHICQLLAIFALRQFSQHLSSFIMGEFARAHVQKFTILKFAFALKVTEAHGIPGSPVLRGKKVMMQHLGSWSKNCHDQKLRIHQLSFDSCWLQLKLLAVPVTCPFFFSWELLPLPLQLELSHHGFFWMWNCSQKAWKVHLLLKLGPPGWVFISQKLQEQRWRELARLW